VLHFKNRNLHTPAALRDFSGHSRAVDRAQLHARSADRRSSATSQKYWELSFVNEDGGRQTRLEVTSASLPSEHTLALARACVA